MKIRSFQINNFRGINSAQLDSLQSLTVLVGPSGSGKTSVIEGLKIFFDNLDGKLQRLMGKMETRCWYKRIVGLPIHLNIMVELNAEEITKLPENIVQALGLKKTGGEFEILGQITYSAESCKIAYTIPKLEAATPIDTLESPVGEIANEPISEKSQVEVGPLVKLVGKKLYWIPGSRFMNPITPAVEGNRPPYIPVDIQERIVSLNNSDKPEDVKQFASILKAFEAVLPKGCRFAVDNHGIQVYEDDSKFPLSLLGSGQQAYLYILFEVIRWPDSVLAIEDPELFLHPKLARELFRFLRSFGSQIFIITHSPIFLDLVAIENNWLLTRGAEGTEIKRAKRREDLEELLEILGSEATDTLYPNKVLIIGGATEEKVIPNWLRLLDGDPNSPQLRIIPIDGDYDWRVVKGWIDATRGTPTEIYLFLDGGAKTLSDKAEKEGVREENIHILPKEQSIEDCYPTKLVEKHLEAEFGIDWKTADGTKIAKIDDSKSKVEEIRRIILEKFRIKKDYWKTRLGDLVSSTMAKGEIPRDVRIFLTRVLK